MSESKSESLHDNPVEEKEEELKYFGFVYIVAANATVYLSNMYDYAKNKSGPLKPGVETVEEKVKTVVTPLYQRFNALPILLLKYVDQKVDRSVSKIDGRVPETVKQISARAISAAQKAPSIARSVVSEVQRSGVTDTVLEFGKGFYFKYEPTAKGLYTKYETAVEDRFVVALLWFNTLPVVPHVTTAAAPVAASLSEKYNHLVNLYVEKGNKWVAYFPLIPTERIAKAFRDRGGAEEDTVPVEG